MKKKMEESRGDEKNRILKVICVPVDIFLLEELVSLGTTVGYLFVQLHLIR